MDRNDAESAYRRGNDYFRSTNGDRYTDLRAAITEYERALGYFTSERYPTDWGEIQVNLIGAKQELSNELKDLEEDIRRLQFKSKPPYNRFLTRRAAFFSFLIVLIVVGLIYLSYPYLFINYLHISVDHFKCVSGTIEINGSTAMFPLIQDVARDYQKRCPGAMIFVINPSHPNPNLPSGSVNGLAQVAKGQIDIGTSDIFADPNQQDQQGRQVTLEDHQIAIVVFALVVNSDVGVPGLTTDQIRSIYSGGDINWIQVGGQNLNIVRISRPATSGTRTAFEKYILGGTETISGPQSLISDTTDIVAQNVKQSPGAIGYVSLYYAKKYGLKILPIDSIAPSIDHMAQVLGLLENETYNFWSIEHMYTRMGFTSELAKAFIDYMYSDTARQIATQDQFLYIGDIPLEVLENH